MNVSQSMNTCMPGINFEKKSRKIYFSSTRGVVCTFKQIHKEKDSGNCKVYTVHY